MFNNNIRCLFNFIRTSHRRYMDKYKIVFHFTSASVSYICLSLSVTPSVSQSTSLSLLDELIVSQTICHFESVHQSFYKKRKKKDCSSICPRTRYCLSVCLVSNTVINWLFSMVTFFHHADFNIIVKSDIYRLKYLRTLRSSGTGIGIGGNEACSFYICQIKDVFG